MLEDAQSYVRVQNIYNPENFDKSLRKVAEFIKEHSDKYKTMPDRTQISAACGIVLQEVPELNEGHYEWFMTEFESFTKRQELERAILKAADLLEKGEFEPVEKLIKDALNSLMKNRTSIIIAHRLSTIIHCDKIIVIANGRVVEEGSHKELLEKNGAYSNLYLKQFEINQDA
jgi:ABC-type oligopeptide transport system ATPase subunit